MSCKHPWYMIFGIGTRNSNAQGEALYRAVCRGCTDFDNDRYAILANDLVFNDLEYMRASILEDQTGIQLDTDQALDHFGNRLQRGTLVMWAPSGDYRNAEPVGHIKKLSRIPKNIHWAEQAMAGARYGLAQSVTVTKLGIMLTQYADGKSHTSTLTKNASSMVALPKEYLAQFKI